jgi:MFS family permease
MASRLNKKVLASYSMVALPIGAMAMPIAIYLPPFYSGGLGLSLATVGLIFTLARVWDLITDPVMGVVIDRYGSRWGQYKHWVALAIPLLMLAIYKLFLPNPSSVVRGLRVTNSPEGIQKPGSTNIFHRPTNHLSSRSVQNRQELRLSHTESNSKF